MHFNRTYPQPVPNLLLLSAGKHVKPTTGACCKLTSCTFSRRGFIYVRAGSPPVKAVHKRPLQASTGDWEKYSRLRWRATSRLAFIRDKPAAALRVQFSTLMEIRRISPDEMTSFGSAFSSLARSRYACFRGIPRMAKKSSVTSMCLQAQRAS